MTYKSLIQSNEVRRSDVDALPPHGSPVYRQ
jgi:hypothetical protein